MSKIIWKEIKDGKLSGWTAQAGTTQPYDRAWIQLTPSGAYIVIVKQGYEYTTLHQCATLADAKRWFDEHLIEYEN